MSLEHRTNLRHTKKLVEKIKAQSPAANIREQTFGAANLVKYSCKQLAKLSKYPTSFDSFHTEQVDEGAAFQKAQSVCPYIEMGSTFTYPSEQHGTIHIKFCIDEIILYEKNKVYFVEHKLVKEPVEDWYFKSCLIQAGFYKSLSDYCNYYQTASFVKGETYKLDLSNSLKYTRLNFGGTWYSIIVRHPNEVIRFYLTKARASRNFGTAARFDEKFKHKEWGAFFKDFYRKWEKPF